MKRFPLLLLLFFTLFISCEDETYYPLASFKIINGKGTSGFLNILDASSSTSLNNSAESLLYRWDLDGDHSEKWDTEWSDNPLLYFIYPNISYAIIGLQVKDQKDQITTYYQNTESYLGAYDMYLSSTANQINYIDIDQQWLRSNIYDNDSIGIFNPYEITPIETGSYYTWATAMQKFNSNEQVETRTYEQRWDVPSLEQWQVLIEYYGGELVAGYNLSLNLSKSIQLVYSGLYQNNVLTEYKTAGYYWTSTKEDENNAYAIKVTENENRVEIVVLPIDYAISIRLLIQHNNN